MVAHTPSHCQIHDLLTGTSGRWVVGQIFHKVSMGQITTRGSDILRQADEVTLTLQQRLETCSGLLSHLQPLHEVVSGD